MKGDKFVQGYACAVANIIRSHGGDTDTTEAIEALGVTTEKGLRSDGVSEYDIKTLLPTLAEIDRRRKRRTKSDEGDRG